MKFLIPIVAFSALTLAQEAPAEPPIDELPEYIQPYAQVLANINESTIALDVAIEAFTGPNQVPGLFSASQQLLKLIKDGVEIIKPLPIIPAVTDEEIDAIFALGSYVFNLAFFVNATVADLVEKKQVLVDSCVGPVVLDQILKQNDSAAQLSSIIVTDKIPSTLQDNAAYLASGIPAALISGIAAYATETTAPASCLATTTATSDGTSTSTGTTSGISSPTTYATATTASYTGATSRYSTASVTTPAWEEIYSNTVHSHPTSPPSDDCEDDSTTVHPNPSQPTTAGWENVDTTTVHPHPSNPPTSIYQTTASYTVHPHPSDPATSVYQTTASYTVHPHPSNPSTSIYQTTASNTVHPHPSSPAVTTKPYTGAAPQFTPIFASMAALLASLAAAFIL